MKQLLKILVAVLCILMMALPVFAGLGVSMATAAALYSGGTGLAVGAASSLGLNKVGSAIDKKFVRKDRPESPGEVQCA